MTGKTTIVCRKVVKGKARGRALLLKCAFSFLGDVDLDSGEIIARGHEAQGELIAGRILFYPEAKGSSGGCAVLATLVRKGRGPAAIVNVAQADYNLVEGAILAGIPLVSELKSDPFQVLNDGDEVEVDGDAGVIRLA